jgi:class 3 adenylate cyclase
MSRLNRTFICSVVFLDIVGYSEKTVEDQIKLKDRLNRYVAEAIKDVAVNDRIILDTGDGAAIGFLGDPEDALFVALSLKDAMGSGHEPLSVRTGINLGPVKLVKDINGRPNLIGDGINIAQRVMTFAKPGQILVSRSYYDVVSCLSQEYAQLFHYLGLRADKHIREHEIYYVEQRHKDQRIAQVAHDEATEVDAHAGAAADKKTLQEARPVKTARKSFKELWSEGTKKLKKAWISVENILSKLPRWRTHKLYYGAIPIAILLIVLAVVFLYKPGPTEPGKTAEAESAIMDKAEDVNKGNVPPGQANPVSTPPDKDVAPLKTETIAEKQEMPGTAAAPKEALPGAPALLQFAISPWGDVFVDGKRQGASPPLMNLSVAPGKHTIEIKNTTFRAYSQTVDLKPGEKLRITHKFR